MVKFACRVSRLALIALMFVAADGGRLAIGRLPGRAA
jgi:hypothetical protein